MKKLSAAIVMLLVIAMAQVCRAGVEGFCSNCHTMHNSQEGAPMAVGGSDAGWENGALTGDPDAHPNVTLLIADCIGCHTSGAANTIVNVEGTRIPIVYNIPIPQDPLAGGNFHDVLTLNGDVKGHNVLGIAGPDATLGLTPPGGIAMDSQLTCAGLYGCHGDRTVADELGAIKTAHHTNDSGGIDGSSVGLSYRFLNGILGIEDGDWEQDNDNTSHNEYQGSANLSSNTMSYLCAACHGQFHTWHWQGGASEVGTASPWLRHPTDIVLPADGEYQYYNGGAGGITPAPYSMLTPLARPELTSIPDPSMITPGTDIVMCLSCHRAHATPYDAVLRWDYKSTTLSDAFSGCGNCHTSKK